MRSKQVFEAIGSLKSHVCCLERTSSTSPLELSEKKGDGMPSLMSKESIGCRCTFSRLLNRVNSAIHKYKMRTLERSCCQPQLLAKCSHVVELTQPNPPSDVTHKVRPLKGTHITHHTTAYTVIALFKNSLCLHIFFSPFFKIMCLIQCII